MGGSRWLKGWAVLNGALVVTLVGAALFGEGGVVRHERLAEELAQIRALNDELLDDNRRLGLEVDALRHDDAYVESVIRDELGVVRPNEVVFILPGPGPGHSPAKAP
jgi:cell division protein FtsB